ncbi:MAG: glycerophosphoryl diester phosphodiesterase [Solirubrobacteraceae bacterium]|nr:glycerophosphoryl diester phosphodiesterase [Solirubrobacteraceae bacterium]
MSAAAAREPRCERVAHGILQGRLSHAAAIAQCQELGLEMVEVDVIGPPWSTDLVVAHDLQESQAAPLGFTAALELLADGLSGSVRLNIDLKLPGYEEEVAQALRRYGLSDRVLVSTTENSSLALLRARHPDLPLGWSLPRMRRDPLANPVTMLPALAVLTYVRRALPGVAANRIRRGEIDALMAHYKLITPRLADAIRAAGGELYAWTVDDAQRIAELERLGVTGVISNDPRLFGP